MENRKCLNDIKLLAYLEGSLSAAERGGAEAHLVSCDSCRGQLGGFMRILDDEVQEEEETIVSQAVKDWRPAEPAVQARQGFRWWLACAAALLVAFATLFYYRIEPSVPVFEEALALDLLNEPMRSLRMRLSLFDSPESYRPLVAVRSDPDAAAGVPDLSSAASAGGGSHARGLYFLARRDFDEAVPLLERAVIEADTPGARNDLGVAYMERTWATPVEEALYRELALTQFEIAIALEERFAPARFNLVLWYERASIEGDALRAQADAYLRLDPSSGWADEVRAVR